MVEQIPEVVVDRLPTYARTLTELQKAGREIISSQELGDRLGVTPAQIRKDLSYFGRFGKQGRGYNVDRLLAELKQILGLDRTWRMALIGVGNLGQAILSYGGFPAQGFNIVAAFDNDRSKVGTRAADLTVHDVADLDEVLTSAEVDIGIVAVPAGPAQGVADALVRSGIRGILNYAPATLRVPDGVWVRNVDPVLALESMTYYLKQALKPPAALRRRA